MASTLSPTHSTWFASRSVGSLTNSPARTQCWYCHMGCSIACPLPSQRRSGRRTNRRTASCGWNWRRHCSSAMTAASMPKMRLFAFLPPAPICGLPRLAICVAKPHTTCQCQPGDGNVTRTARYLLQLANGELAQGPLVPLPWHASAQPPAQLHLAVADLGAPIVIRELLPVAQFRVVQR